MSVVAGIGCRRGCAADEIAVLVARALAESGRTDLVSLAAPRFKGREPGLYAAAEKLRVPVTLVGEDAMDHAGPRCATMTRASIWRKPRPSIAECAALAAAGPAATLLLPRINSARATCALAEGDAP